MLSILLHCPPLGRLLLAEVLYETLREEYLHPLAMESLLKANQLLKAKQPNYSLLVLDAARPMSIQKRMWDKVKGTPHNIYVSNPNKGGGMHNYGMAVDITIVDEQGEWLSMGTEFDPKADPKTIPVDSNIVTKENIK